MSGKTFAIINYQTCSFVPNHNFQPTSLSFSLEELLADYLLACQSRQASLLGRKEVFAGKAKFGIFGDGKEIAQLAMAKVFRPGDFRAGYYRDQTFMLATGSMSLEQFFAQLYANPCPEAEPSSAGRMMNGHFGTRMLEADGSWKNLSLLKNSSSDISPTGSQMPRLLGLAYASKLYRHNGELSYLNQFSDQGNEIAFGTIGNASTSEGMFFEAINAAGVLQVPMLVSVWDDEYGISVPSQYHTTKEDISKALAGFQRTEFEPGLEIFRAKGWDYEALCQTYLHAANVCRLQHIPVLIHVLEMTQPQGHSTSGSHERYKTKERLAWETEFDCLTKMRQWIESIYPQSIVQLDQIEKQAIADVREARNAAWQAFNQPILDEQNKLISLFSELEHNPQTDAFLDQLVKLRNPVRADMLRAAHALMRQSKPEQSYYAPLKNWINTYKAQNQKLFNTHLHSESAQSIAHLKAVLPRYSTDAALVDGREIIQKYFDFALGQDPRIFIIGEDVGRIGDVNQGLAGLQAKYGELRISDTGIRECTIIGQGIGAALRGLKPIVEIQYLDYLAYGLQILSDDLASLQYRTKGGQKAPLIIRTRGHRLEGVWHSGSPMGMIIHALRGIYVLVPRDLTQAAGFYAAMLETDEPALIIEPLNGYRQKEKMPQNLGHYKVLPGHSQILRSGNQISIVTYGSMCRIVMEAAELLQQNGISVEVIDVQSLLPFDVNQLILQSVKKTNRIIFADEDVPGGATAYMLEQAIDQQGIFKYLDSAPRTITAKAHRPAYSSDGDYFSKPNAEEIYDLAWQMMNEAEPDKYVGGL